MAITASLGQMLKLNLLPQKLYSFFFESYLGIQTTGWAPPTVEGGVRYSPLPYYVIRRILRHLSMTTEDVFVDIGCGKGRVLCCASRLPLRKVVGIDVNEDLVKAALINALKTRKPRAAIEVLAVPADRYHYDDATVLYLYNPFDHSTMTKVFAKIGDSLHRNPRRLRVVYANCKHEEPLWQTAGLVKTEEWPASTFPAFGCPISFWVSDPRRICPKHTQST